MPRGRPKLSQDEKDRRKEQKLASADQAIADTAMAKMPVEKDRRDELWRAGEALKAKAQGVAGEIGQHKKRLVDVFGYTKPAIRIRDILVKCSDGEYEATIKQVGIFLKDIDRPFQLSMFDAEPGKGIQPDEGSIFDKTSSGEKVAAERGDDPGRAGKRRGKGGPPVPPKDTGSLSADEALAKFEAAKEAAGGPTDDEDEDLRPRLMRQAGEPKGLGPDAIH